MRWIGAGLAVAAAVGLVGCDLFRTTVEEVTWDEATATPEQLAAHHIGQGEELRQRPSAEARGVTRGDVSGMDAAQVPAEVLAQWEQLAPMLFGAPAPALVLDDPRWARGAVWDEETNAIVIDEGVSDEEIWLWATSMVAHQRLEEELIGPLPEVETLDQWLSREIIRRAGPTLVSSMMQATRFEVGLELDALVEQPDTAVHIPLVGSNLEVLQDGPGAQPQEPGEGVEFFEEALQKLVMRKSLALGSALYRAGEWVGVEWGRSEPSLMTQSIVQPQRWFEGDGPTRWEWDQQFEDHRAGQGFEEVYRGEVGPLLMALWLEGVVGPRPARTIFSGWRGDAYRIYQDSREEGVQRAMLWTTVWERPDDAREIASALEAVLGHYLGAEHRDQRFRVSLSGLNVAVVIYDTDQAPQELDVEADLLAQSRVGFLPAQAAPFEYVPTLYDRYVEHAQEAILDLDRHRWTDPAAGWRVDLDELREWSVQRSNEAHVRWFATHHDGSLVQWTTELIDPLGAEFASPNYLSQLSQAFGRSISAQQEPRAQVVESPVETTVTLEVIGLIEGRPLVLQMWQWRRGDVLVSFSLQGPESSFGERLAEVEAILESLDHHGEAVARRVTTTDDGPIEDDGIIEFSVEEE